MLEESFVYIIARLADDGYIAPCKIGISDNPGARVSALQTAVPFRVGLFRKFRMPARSIARETERVFHETQDRCRLHGEWFDLAPERASLLVLANIECAFIVDRVNADHQKILWSFILDGRTPQDLIVAGLAA